MMTATTSAMQLPQEVEDYLDRFVARRRMQRLLTAFAAAATATIVWGLAWCIIDRLVALPAGVRVAALGVNVAVVALLLARPLWDAISCPVDCDSAAADVERRDRSWSQRLRTVTSRAIGPADIAGSRQMLDALAGRVAEEARGKDPKALLPWSAMTRPFVALAIALALAAALTMSNWLGLGVLARRYVTPLAGVRPVTTTRLAVIPGDAEVAEGEAVRVHVRVDHVGGNVGTAATLRVRPADSDGAWHEEPMLALSADGAYEGRLRQVSGDLEYVVAAGDAVSDVFRVTVLKRPAVTQFRVRCAYPPHTGLAPRETENATGEVEAPAGTEVMLAIETTQPLRYAVLTIGPESIRSQTASATQDGARGLATQRAGARFAFTVREDRPYTLRMVSERGVSGAFRGGRVREIPDRPPVVSLRGGGGDGSEAARAIGGGDVATVSYLAVDDFGLARLDAEVRVIRRSGAEASVVTPVPLATRGTREQQGTFPVELSWLGASAGDIVEVRLRAEDRGGQLALSTPVRLAITSDAPASGETTTPTPGVNSSVASSPSASERNDDPPLDPAGYGDAIRMYFEALRRPTTRP